MLWHGLAVTSSSEDPVLRRVRDGLEWPSFESWSETTSTIPTPRVPVSPTDHDARQHEVESRLARCRLVGDGGPWLETFDQQVAARLATERGDAIGPLGDFTFAIKDLVAIEGRRISAGSAVRSQARDEPKTAPIVTALEALGAVALGTVTLHEFAFGVIGVNPYAGTPTNPAAPGRITGGSSSGSAAAVADGSARIAIGTDTGGSIRGPASFCGVVGFKPTFGCFPTAGVFPLSTSLDHVGFFATSTADIAEVHRSMGQTIAAPQLPKRIGLARADLAAADRDVQLAITAALDRLSDAGVEVVDVAWPDSEQTFVASTAIMFSEASAIHRDSVAAHPELYGADIKARLELGATLTGPEVAAAHQLRRQLISLVQATLAGVEVIVGPTTPLVAPTVVDAGDPGLPPRIVSNTRLGNVVGLPAISLPVATTGPPVGLQLLGATDSGVLSAAAAIEPIVL